MPQETVGYTELEWTCKFCGMKNPGLQKTCSGCGAAMATDDKFELPAQQKIITDAEKLKQAESGPDKACPYCGTRNPVDAKVCKNCGGDLVGAKSREAGQVLGAFKSGPAPDVPCPFCGAPNPAGASRCKKCGGTLGQAPAPKPPAAAPAKNSFGLLVVAIVALVCLGAGAIAIIGGRTTSESAVVQSVAWERAIAVLELRPVEKSGWKNDTPSGTTLGSCQERVRRVQDSATSRSRKVCGTAYTVDQGTGAGKVVRDCQYEVLDDWCAYTVKEWRAVKELKSSGADLNPKWPEVSLSSGQRDGNRTEHYRVVMQANDKNYDYHPDSEQEYRQFAPGSRWTIKVNGFGDIVDAKQAR